PLRMSANGLAKALHVPTPRINEVVRKRRGVSADTAMRLARYFGGDARADPPSLTRSIDDCRLHM
ncbi:MAG TPA: HigA family addiction module antitoxin, partial [Steroidobacteraceae bacterium]|nr:HigA family addiction module antitoxin [Steroidobacteraceae bacterium]